METMLALSRRGDLLNPQVNYIRNMIKGYDGECVFDELLRNLKCDCLILNDLTLRINGQTCQIDTLLISNKGVTIYEVKNFEGAFIYRDDKLKILSSNKEISNPVHQLNRTLNLFRQLMEEQQMNFEVQAYVIFVNDQFTLFETPVDVRFILPTMLSHHLKILNNERGGLNKSHYRFAETLKQLHLNDLSYLSLPEYSYSSLKNGAFCKDCSTMLKHPTVRMCECKQCGQKESTSDTILR